MWGELIAYLSGLDEWCDVYFGFDGNEIRLITGFLGCLCVVVIIIVIFLPVTVVIGQQKIHNANR